MVVGLSWENEIVSGCNLYAYKGYNLYILDFQIV